MGFNYHEIKTQRTQCYAKYIHDSEFEDFPEEVTSRAKQLLIQTIGKAVSAVNSETAKKARILAERASGGTAPTAGVWGTACRFSAENAAMANGVSANLSGWEQNPYGMPACGAVPTAWAVAEAKKRSGKELLTAIILGYEVYERLAAAVQPSEAERARKGYGRSSWQVFAALVPALKLMALDTLEINKGLSLGTACSVIPASHYENDGADTLPFEFGFRNQNAVTLACHTLRGIENMEDAFDDPSAYWMHFTDEEKADEYTKELGTAYRILFSVPELGGDKAAEEFCNDAAGVFADERMKQILDMLFEIEHCEDISEAGKLLLL